jgi:hypothetical protein
MAKKKTPIDENAIPEQATLERTKEQGTAALKRKVRMFYDLQRLRLQTAGRVALPKPPEDPEEAVTVEASKAPEGKDKKRKIDIHPADQAILELRAQELLLAEKRALKDVEAHLNTIGFYRDVLTNKTRYKGIGPTMAGVILAEFDINRLPTVSSMWAYAGLAPIAAMRCAKCHRVVENRNGVWEHLGNKKKPGTEDEPAKVKCVIENVYESGKAMKPTKGEKLRYNAFLRSKLCGVLGGVILKLNPSDADPISPWRKCYDDYKHRKATAGWGTSDAHRHMAATRYMIKMLLADIWSKWREYEGLPTRPTYFEEKMGHTHGGGTLHTTGRETNEALTPEMEEELSQHEEAAE